MSKKVLFKFDKSGGEFLSIEQVNSAIRWTMDAEVKESTDKEGKPNGTTLYANATISLTDCNRWISWDGYGHNKAEELDDMMKKVATAIDQLQSFRMNLATMQRGIRKVHKGKDDSDE